MDDSPLLIESSKPSMESLEKYLGEREFKRFDKIYKEFLALGYNANLEWNRNDQTWFYRYYKDDSPLFDLRLGDDYFYAQVKLSTDDYLQIGRDPGMTEAAHKLLHKYPENKVRKMVRVEAELDKMSDQEGFFDLLPALTKVLLG